MSIASKHRITWFEIPVADLDAAAKLYGAMLGYELKRAVQFGIPHAILATEEGGVTGTLISDPRRPPRRGIGTTVYLHAPDGVAPCVSRATEAGAKVIQPATEIAPYGTMAIIEDLDGNVVGLHAL